MHVNDGASAYALACDDKECFQACYDDDQMGGVCLRGTCACESVPSRAVGGGSARPLRPADECNDEACDKTCYQRGDSIGGSCHDGKCECTPILAPPDDEDGSPSQKGA